jgi:hypothetical protein
VPYLTRTTSFNLNIPKGNIERSKLQEKKKKNFVKLTRPISWKKCNFLLDRAAGGAIYQYPLAMQTIQIIA